MRHNEIGTAQEHLGSVARGGVALGGGVLALGQRRLPRLAQPLPKVTECNPRLAAIPDLAWIPPREHPLEAACSKSG